MTSTGPARGAGAKLPKYLLIYRTLADEIGSGTYHSETALPTQRELALRFGVTVMTVRQAVRLLEDEGLLVTRQGAGTFVARDSFTYELGTLRSLSDDFSDIDLVLKTTVLGAALVPAPSSVIARMNLNDPHVLAVERLRSATNRNGEEIPLLLQTSYLPQRYADKLTTHALENRSLYRELSEQAGVRIGHADETLQAASLSERESQLLSQPPGSAALLSRRLTYDIGGTPVVDDRALLTRDVVLSTPRRLTVMAPTHDLQTQEKPEKPAPR